MIYINNLSITNDFNSLSVNVTTNVGSNITKVLLWNDNTFKDYSQAIDLTFKLEQVNNNEIFIVSPSDINISSFTGIWFLEFTSDYEEEGCSTCSNSVIGIASNLNNIKSIILNEILELNNCHNCGDISKDYDNVINLHLINKGICTALQLGYYEEAIYLYKKIRKILSSELECKSCRELRTPIYNQGLNFGILNNSLILI